MPAKNPSDSIRELLAMQRRDEPKREVPFADTIPSVEDVNTPVYETSADPSFPAFMGGPKGYTLTPPKGPPKRGSREETAAAHQRRRALK